jgi:ribosomal protein S18 acetylase RimI-like enzyme
MVAKMELFLQPYRENLYQGTRMAGFKIRKVAIEEAERAYALVEEYFQAAKVVAREDRGKFEEEYFAENAGVWAAEIAGELVGCIALRKLTAQGAHIGEIKRMYVRPEYRGQGIAEGLLSALENFARQHGYEELYLDTAADMTAAARLYERCGYERRERYNDNPQAAIFMRKRMLPKVKRARK